MTDVASSAGASPAEASSGPQPDALAQIEAMKGEIMASGGKHPYHDPAHPEHHATIARWNALWERAYPNPVQPEPSTPQQVWDHENAAPETPEGYDVELRRVRLAENESIEDAAEGLAIVRDWMHSAGMSRIEARTLVERFNELGGDPNRADPDRAEATLRGLWRDEYDANLAAANRAADRVGGEPFRALLRETSLGNDPFVIRTFADLAKRKGW